VLDPHRQEIFLRQPDMKLDLGGIGKGFMAQRACETLRQRGIQAGVVANAGDLVLFGTKPDGRPWRIGVQHPRHPGKMLAALELTDCAVSTSGDYERFFTRDGVMYHHILDASTLLPARDCQSVTVIGRDATLVDALATGIFVLGPSPGLQLLERTRLGEGIIIDRQGRTSISPSLEAKVILDESIPHTQP
jgi:thiamine biosynthesis lipoprotein